MLGTTGVSPIWDEDSGPKTSKPEEKAIFFNASAELRKRIDRSAGTEKGALKRWMTALVESELDLEEMLEPFATRIRNYAQVRGLSMRSDKARILASLVEAGLDALEQKKPAKK